VKKPSGTLSEARDNQRGFSLIETVVAAGLVAGAFAALAQMFALSIAHNNSARNGSATMILAAQKMEELRGLSWGRDLLPGGSLRSDVAGYVDYTDRAGNILGAGAPMPPAPIYIRRWSVNPLPSSPDALVLQVLVTRASSGAIASVAAVEGNAARLVSVTSRTTP